MITLISFFPFVTSILILLLGFYVLIQNPRSAINRLFYFFALSIFIWQFFYSLAYFYNDTSSELYFKIGYIGVFFIPTTWLHFTVLFLRKKKLSLIIGFFYLTSTLYCTFNLLSDNFISGLFQYSWGLYPKVIFLSHIFFLFFFVSAFSMSMTLLLLSIIFLSVHAIPQQTIKIKYVFLATFIGTFAGVDFLPNYGINIYPFGFVFMLLFIFLTAFSIIKYRFLDISLAFTRTGIFILVYSFVLGIPFAIAFGLREYLVSFIGAIWWIVPLIASTTLGAVGPFIYFFIQRKAEGRLLREQKRYQATLKQASVGMMRINDLKKLLNLIVYILARAVNLSHAYIYLYDPKSRDYTLEATRGEKALEKNFYLSKKSALINYLDKVKVPIVFEEIKQQSQDYDSEELRKVQDDLSEFRAAVAVPIFTERRLLSVGILGNKKSGAMYTADDLTVFSILANQVALAIENAQFYEESKNTQEQLFQAEKMATIGTMADGLSHQINNRLHTLGFIAGDAIDTIKLKKDLQDPQQFQEVLRELERALAKIQDNVRQGGEIVQGLLRYTRKGQEGFNEVVFDKLIDDVIEMAQFKIKKEYVSIVKEYSPDQPLLQGNSTQLQEVFFNIIDNAYDAIMQKRVEIPDENFKGIIKISTRIKGKFLEVDVVDNGIGVKEDDQGKLFTPFFTTKASSRKGTGLGLYVIRKIVEDNHQGEILISSDYKIGTLFVVRLPMAEKKG